MNVATGEFRALQDQVDDLGKRVAGLSELLIATFRYAGVTPPRPARARHLTAVPAAGCETAAGSSPGGVA